MRRPSYPRFLLRLASKRCRGPLPHQRLKAEDIITPQEFEEAVRGSFRDIMRDSNARVGKRSVACTVPPSGPLVYGLA